MQACTAEESRGGVGLGGHSTPPPPAPFANTTSVSRVLKKSIQVLLVLAG